MSPCENKEGPREDSRRASERVRDVPNTRQMKNLKTKIQGRRDVKRAFGDKDQR